MKGICGILLQKQRKKFAEIKVKLEKQRCLPHYSSDGLKGTRLSGFVQYKTITKMFAYLIICFHGFTNFTKIECFWRQMFIIFSIHILPWGHVGHVSCLNIFGPDRICRFDVYWIQTDRQPQAIYIYI